MITLQQPWTPPDVTPCQLGNPDDWYPQPAPRLPRRTQAAIEACQTCPYQTECVEAARDQGEDQGIWGGIPAWKIPGRVRRQPTLRFCKDGKHVMNEVGRTRNGTCYGCYRELVVYNERINI